MPTKPERKKADWPNASRFKIYVQSIALTKDAILMANASYLRLGILRRGTKTPEEVELPGSPQSLELSPDKTEVAYVYGNLWVDGVERPAGLVIADAATGATRFQLEKIEKDPQMLLWSPDGEHLLVWSYPNKVLLYRARDVRAGKLAPKKLEVKGSGACVWARDSRALLMVGDDALLRYGVDGKVTSGKLPNRYSRHGLAIAPDGTLAQPTFVFSQEGRVRWHEKIEDWCEAVEFSPDGSKLVCAAAAVSFLRGKNAKSEKPGKLQEAFVSVHDAKNGRLLKWAPRPVKREVRALAVDEEKIVVGRDSGVDIFTWEALGVSPCA